MEFVGNLEINTTLAGIIGLAIICVPAVLLSKLQMDNQQQQQRIKKLEEELRQAKKYINNLEQFQQKTIKDTMQAAIIYPTKEENLPDDNPLAITIQPQPITQADRERANQLMEREMAAEQAEEEALSPDNFLAGELAERAAGGIIGGTTDSANAEYNKGD